MGEPHGRRWFLGTAAAAVPAVVMRWRARRKAAHAAAAAAGGNVPVTVVNTGSFNPPALPPGVTLQAPDGGATYYASNGFSYAAAAGWDDPSFFPIGVWYGHVLVQGDCDRWHDLGLNTAFRTTSDTVLSLLQSNGIWAVVACSTPPGTPETPGMGSETVGLLTIDEPGAFSQVQAVVQATPNSVQDGRFWWLNNTWNFIVYNGLAPTSQVAVLTTPITTPDGSTRHVDVQSVDQYWFAGAARGGTYPNNVSHAAGYLYGGTTDMTQADMCVGSHYGDLVDMLRPYQAGGYAAPILQFVEDGGPYGEDTVAGAYIQPAELNWAVWGSIIHGARQICYFNHSFAGPAISDDNLAQTYYQTVQPGQTVSIYAQVKATNALVTQLAPVINAPAALGYFTVTPAPATPEGGIDAAARYSGGKFFILAATRLQETFTNISATFTTAGGYTGPVTVIGEGRTVPATGGVFTDTFATASAVHIYQVG